MAAEQRDELLLSYQRELGYLRQMGAEFAARYPKIAARLDLSADQCADPHVERLIEAFAFLTARLQRQLESEFPEFTSALLRVLYPHFIDPVPAMSIARMEPDLDQGLPLGGFEVPPQTLLTAETESGETCHFRTCYPVTLWPIKVAEARFEPTDAHPFLDAHPQVATVLRLRLRARPMPFSKLEMKSLRFFINAEGQTGFSLYDLLAGGLYGVALSWEGGGDPIVQPPETLRTAGLGPNEAVLPAPSHAHPAYRLLQEYFTFPDKFLFFDLELPEARKAKNTLDVLLLFKELSRRRLSVSADTFCLGCTPIINLFPKIAEPIRVEELQTDYRLIPDIHDERITEIHSIDKLASSPDPHNVEILEPFFSFSHPADGDEHRAFYHLRRRPTGRVDLPGTDVYLSFVDLRFTPMRPPMETIYAHTLCTNRELAVQMPVGAVLQTESPAPVKDIVCLRKPTIPIGMPVDGPAIWRLISQLSLNHLSLIEGEQSLMALREMLRLYCFLHDTSSENQIMGLTQLQSRPVMIHMGNDAWRGFCQGLEVALTFNEGLYVGSSALLFSSVLSHFFGLYTGINSFTKLVVKSEQRQGVWKRWPPMAGAKPIL